MGGIGWMDGIRVEGGDGCVELWGLVWWMGLYSLDGFCSKTRLGDGMDGGGGNGSQKVGLEGLNWRNCKVRDIPALDWRFFQH